MYRSAHFSMCVFSLCVIASSSGCQSLDLSQLKWRHKIPEASTNNPVREVICLWEPAEGVGIDDKPCRGFAGQLLFFSARERVPVKINSRISIYVFDDFGTAEESSKPIHVFEFEPDAWNTYLSDSNIGASYQLFIPYTRKGNHQATCTLRVKYEPQDGIPVFSKMASIILAGSPKGPAPSQQIASIDNTPSSRPIERANMTELKMLAEGAVGQPEPPSSGSLTSNTTSITSGTSERLRLKAKLSGALEQATSREGSTEKFQRIPTHPVPEHRSPDLVHGTHIDPESLVTPPSAPLTEEEQVPEKAAPPTLHPLRM